MTAGLRKTGISVVGDIPWGTHLCQFYETKEDLLDILIPYFKAGLEANEYCLWLVDDFLSEEEARSALRRAVPEAERFLVEDRIEIIPHTDWYLKDGSLSAERLIEGWNEKLADVSAKGYAGLRANGDESWLREEHWEDFLRYERALDGMLVGRRLLVLCSYPLSGVTAAEFLDVANTHQFALVRRRGDWEIVETPELKQTKAEIKRLNEGLEQRVAERTGELVAANEKLRREIAERERAEEKLKQSESQLAEAQRLAHLGSWNWDLRSNALSWSDELYHIFGVDRQIFNPAYEEFVTDFIHPEDQALARGSVDSALKTRQPFSFCSRILRPDGEERVIHSRGEVVCDEHGAPVRMFGTAQDVTERKRAEEALKESQRKLEEAQSIAHVGHFEHDLETGVVYMSDENYRILGLPPQDSIALSKAFEYIHPDDRERLHRAREEGVRTGQRIVVDYRYLRPDGQVRYVHSESDVIYDEEGRPRRTFGILQDVTERKRAEEMRQTFSQRLIETQEAERRRVARELHDEIGQALTAIKINLQAVQHSADGSPLAPQLNESAGLVDRALQQVRDLSFNLRPSLLDDLGLIAALRWYVDQEARRADLIPEFVADLSETRLPPELETACFRITQEALTNVARHARARRIWVELRQPGAELHLTIRDDGIGFEVGAVWRRRASDAGLGLQGMQERALIVGGKIEIKSAPARGTEVHVWFPLPEAVPPAAKNGVE